MRKLCFLTLILYPIFAFSHSFDRYYRPQDSMTGLQSPIMDTSRVYSSTYCNTLQKLDNLWEFKEVFYIPDGNIQPSFPLLWFDTNHNLKNELIMLNTGAYTNIYENTNDNEYYKVCSLPYRFCPCAVGYIDEDSLTDLIVAKYFEPVGGTLFVFESPSFNSFPTQPIWKINTAFDPVVMPSQITDLDNDGKRELFISNSQWHEIYIYENTGDNSYELVFQQGGLTFGEMVWGDFDLDGHNEFIFGGQHGEVYAWEHTTGDNYDFIWEDTVDTYNVYHHRKANDMDQDGKPEFIVMGCNNVGGQFRYLFTVFETTGDNQYEPVWSTSIPGGNIMWGCGGLASGDVDGDGVDELVFTNGKKVEIWRCNGPNSFELIWDRNFISHQQGIQFIGLALCVYDFNQNGWGEIVVSGYTECVEDTGDVETFIFERAIPVEVIYPNGGEELTGNTIDTIRWLAEPPVDSITILLSFDSGNTYTDTIAYGIQDDSPQPWAVPDTEATNCKIKIEAHGYNLRYGDAESNSTFTIKKTGIEEDLLTPKDFYFKIFPNPFRRTAMISVKCQAPSASLQIYDLSGRLVKSFSLATDNLPLTTAVSWDAKEFPAGVYFCKLRIESKGSKEARTKKLILIR
ncbi:T9SS type A sorting domain-containing protein [candidate division WOR-3 bacterium]|nr:T9SS type A sorting domain-containing protein [candidate division WOR-3 bacterium]